jgi:hypothetical protein
MSETERWECGLYLGGAYYIQRKAGGARGPHLADVYGGEKVARLMTAAPDMLAALKAALEWVVLYWNLSPELVGNEPELAAQLRAAITKAEGREP